MWIIAFFIVLGILLLIAELIVFSGTAVAGILSFFSFAAGVIFSWKYFGTTGIIASLIAVLLLSIITAAICMHSTTWKKLTLKSTIDSVSQDMPQNRIEIGTTGKTATRLAPMGKIIISGELYEARCNDTYVDPDTPIEVIGFDNFTVIVKTLKQ